VYAHREIDAILDEALFCHVACVVDGHPRVIPTIHVRVGDTLYIHGSQASRTLRALRDGSEVCIAVTLLDGLVLARSVFNHSMNYRSVVVYGRAREVTDADEKWNAQRALVEHVVPGRSEEARMPDEKELKQTAILAVPLDEASAKIRTGPPKDDEDDLDLPVWAGVLPFRQVVGDPVDSPDLPPGLTPSRAVRDYRRPTEG
jgi:nitroimidazol reductase NimA-like FMN-containing flavoprotein (pyridoxamine 5'-phosphate oxidase superfamily)